MTQDRPTRVEKDSMGEMSLPESALHGASTHRAVLNFPVSGYRFSRPFIRALGLIKWAAAQANHDLGLLDAERAALIVQAAEEVVEGKLDDHFPLDIFQTGSGTSTNTNANEVIANRCAQLAGEPIGSRELSDSGSGKVTRRSRSQGEGILGRHQDRSDPFDGRDPDPIGAGIFRLRATSCLCEGARAKIDGGVA